MAQLSKGDTFVDGQQLTAARLNQLVDSATLTNGAVKDQTSMTAFTVSGSDTILISDVSENGGLGALRKATIADIIGSGISIKTNSINSDGSLTIDAVGGTNINVGLFTFGFNVLGDGTDEFTASGTTVSLTAVSGDLTISSTSGIVKFPSNYVEFNGTLGSVTFNTKCIVQTPATGTEAANKNYVDGSNTLANPGNQVLPGGLIMKWGSQSVAADSSATVTFTAGALGGPFPNACIGAFANNQSAPSGGGINTVAGVRSFTASSIVISNDNGSTSTINWIAFGW